ncbi:site-specific integrase [Streptomyces caatingaensis]|uniref:site-specific integrase n=1 Tax=Streptomyces caatingaensis TaxID=1678637 RepID=UPI0018E34AB6|nr:site-specific integrase [Streptomyces caatingaensis]
MAEVAVDAAVGEVLTAWATMARRGEMSRQSLEKFALLLARFQRYATARETVLLTEVTEQLASAFIDAPGRTRHGATGEAAPATRHLRRSVLRMFFRTARELGLCGHDPTWALTLPVRTRGQARPLTEDEAIALRHAAEFTDRPTRHAAAAALALSGGHTGEIGHTRLTDLDIPRARVWMHGSSKSAPRWCPLGPWELRVLAARAMHVRAQAPPGTHPAGLKLAVSSRTGSDEQLQARSCVALGDLLRRIGLAADPTVRPASVTAYAAWNLHARTGRIEDAALLLGLSSLDRAAAVIGHHWRPPTAPHTREKAI